MNTDVVLKVENISKKFCRHLKRSMLYSTVDISKILFGIDQKQESLRTSEFWALQNISFELKKGQILGIIGMNGAGKSTLLRILNGIYPPDSGKVTINGTIGGLIALGAGFHPHMSGRENIYLNGIILGMKKTEIDQKLESIIDFADIGQFIDSPVSTYSSGMHARLAFAIAIHCEPDILLIDEVLAVGDFSFQNKCLRKIQEHKKRAHAVIFIGHNMSMIESICDEVILLNQGQILHQGETLDVVSKYRSLSRKKELESELRDKTHEVGFADNRITQYGVGLLDANGNKTDRVAIGENITIYYDFELKINLEKPYFGVGFSHPQVYPWNLVYDNTITHRTAKIGSLQQNKRYRLKVTFQNVSLVPGVYSFNIMLGNRDTSEEISNYNTGQDMTFKVSNDFISSFIIEGERPSYNSLVHAESSWDCKEI